MLKKQLFFLIVAFASKCAYTQSGFVAGEHFTRNQASNLIILNHNLYYAGYVHHSGVADSLLLTSLKADGTKRFRKGPLIKNTERPGAVFADNGKYIATVSAEINCHIASSSGLFHLRDTNGNSVLTTTFSLPDQTDGMIGGFQAMNGIYYIAAENRLVRLNAQGNYLSTLGNFYRIYSIERTGNWQFFISAVLSQGGAPVVYEYFNNVVTDIYYPYSYFRKCVRNKSCYYCLDKNSSISKLDSAFNLLDSSLTVFNHSSGNRISDFIIEQDTIYAIGKNVNSLGSFYLRMDTALQQISLLTNPRKRLNPLSIAKKGNILFTMNNCTSAGSPMPDFTALCAFRQDTIYDFKEDLSIASMTLDTVTYINGNYLGYKVKVKLRNKGTIPVQSFYLNTDLHNITGDCNGRHYQQLFTGFNLQPGDSMLLTTSEINDYTSFNQNTFAFGRVFRLTLPNFKPDRNDEDNVLLAAISGSIAVAVPELKSAGSNPVIIPNPANETVYIQCDATVSEVEVQDCFGVQKFLMPAGNNLFEVSVLPPGLYILSGKAEQQVFTKKLLICR